MPLARRQVQQLVRYLDIDGDKRVGLAEMQALLDLARVVKSAKEKETQQSKDGQQEPESASVSVSTESTATATATVTATASASSKQRKKKRALDTQDALAEKRLEWQG